MPFHLHSTVHALMLNKICSVSVCNVPYVVSFVASPPKPSIGTKRKRSEERRSSAEAEERSSPPKIIKTTADEYRRSDAGSVRTQRVKVEISPEEGQRSGGGSVRKPKVCVTSSFF